ncbi:MAG: class I SAM-dependent methyltransferase [Candidatus Cloacimonetes bacterium]|nr:class I SAM-dependent methyltransferase [Candidatus Cloacimonadota bacterium]
MTESVFPRWLEGLINSPFRRIIHNPAKIVSPYLRFGMIALDVGCGNGYFTLPMARIVGSSGKVLAVDAQQKLLENLNHRAGKAGYLNRIKTFLSVAGELPVYEPADFVLTFWMAHEVSDLSRFFTGIKFHLKPGGRWLLVDPRAKSVKNDFESSINLASKLGFIHLEQPKISLSRCALFGLPKKTLKSTLSFVENNNVDPLNSSDD